MNDYVKGAFEALNWVETLLADIEPEKDLLDQLKKRGLGSSCGGAQKRKRHHNCSHETRA